MKTSKATEMVLQQSQRARDSDNELRLMVLDLMGINFTEYQKAIFRRVNMESVRRTRQKFQEKGLYPSSKFVKDARDFKSLQVQQAIPSVKSEKVDVLLDATPNDEHKAIPWMNDDEDY